jgi:protein-S-isoprenylcysteine O-methyltransferase Ste14
MEKPDIAGVIAPPPLIFLAGLVLGFWLDTQFHLPLPLLKPALKIALSLVTGSLAAVLVFWQFAAFARVGTPERTDRPTTALSTGGPFRFSRNPGYLGMSLLYLSVAVATGGCWTVLMLIPTLLVIRNGVILREEAYLERKFGAEYRSYADRVRRWF